MSTFGSQVVATSLEGDVHHIICAADIVINEIRDVLLKDNERLRDQVRRLLEVQGEQARDMMKEDRKREVTMEWKAMEIERLNDLLIKQANVIEKITAERDALNDALLHVSDMLRWDGDRGNWYLSPQFTVSMVEVALRSVRGE